MGALGVGTTFGHQAPYCLSGMVKFCLRSATSFGMDGRRLYQAGVMVGKCSPDWEAASVRWGEGTVRVGGVNHNDKALRKGRRCTKWSGRRPTWSVPADPHQVGWEKGLWIPTAVRMTGGGVNDNDKALRKGRRRAGWTARRPTWSVPADPLQVGWGKGLWIPTAVRMTGGGVDDNDEALRKGRRCTRWSGRRPTWSVPADPLQVG